MSAIYIYRSAKSDLRNLNLSRSPLLNAVPLLKRGLFKISPPLTGTCNGAMNFLEQWAHSPSVGTLSRRKCFGISPLFLVEEDDEDGNADDEPN